MSDEPTLIVVTEKVVLEKIRDGEVFETVVVEDETELIDLEEGPSCH